MSNAGSTLPGTAKRVRPLLTVAQLRELLERVERNGGGDWDVDIFPDSLVARNAAQDDIDFGLLRYGITGVDTLGGDGTQDFVLMRFAPAPLGHGHARTGSGPSRTDGT
ncbi:hypothetical protein GCM10009557_00160 [Virgisporangium ochraceum]|uniref:Uncharacterized protein n=1 Tax=Virgisporangium ochraceum TaxID=65505 RepID=A0A8J4A4F6_9ACTN|nr:hypothetical protein [Virgisporangium ochraceum]GIJ74048.1 hypothetical protein Voc01_089650 [Virgisporangium ochraceum]